MKTCETCVNRFICPTRKKSKPNNICDGYNNKEVFTSLISIITLEDNTIIKNRLDFIEKLQKE